MLHSSAMRGSRPTSVFVMLALLSAAAFGIACSDTDPRYGPPEAIRGRKIDYGTTAPEEDAGTSTTTPKTAPEAFAALYATFAGAADGTKCTPCHAAGGTGGKFFVATDATSSRAFFLANGYQDITKPNTFATKGQHTGNPLTADQKTMTKTWSDAEKLAGGGGTADAGAEGGI